MTVATLSLEVGVLRNLVDQIFKLNRFPLQTIFAALQPSNGEQPADQFIQTLGFFLNSVERGLRLDAALASHQPKRHVQTRQRRPQLMRDVVQQARLRIDQVLQALRHGVKITDQFANFVMPTNIRHTRPGAEVAGRQALRRSPQSHHRCGDIFRQKITDESRRNDRNDDA